jgi:hypothetical protein
MFLCSVAQGDDVSHGRGQRFFAQDVLACGQGGKGDGGVRAVGRADVDNVDVINRQDIVPVLKRSYAWDQSLCILKRPLRQVAGGDHFGERHGGPAGQVLLAADAAHANKPY